MITLSLKDFDTHLDRSFVELHCSFHYQLSGLAENRRDLTLFSRFLHEKGHQFITGDTLLEFIGYLRTERKNGARATNRKISSIRTYIRFLRFRQVPGAQELPIEYLNRVRGPYPGPFETLSFEEVKRLLESIDRESILGYRDYVLYSLLYRLGLRIGEALRIDLEDIDFNKEVVTIHGKGRRKRVLPLLPDIMVLIATWIALRDQLYDAEKQQALFISTKGNRLAIRTAQENFQKMVIETGPFSIEKVTPHTLRHAFATHAVEGNQDLVVLKTIMGHASITSTEIYLHPSLNKLREAVNDHIAAEILGEIIDSGTFVVRTQQRRKNAA